MGEKYENGSSRSEIEHGMDLDRDRRRALVNAVMNLWVSYFERK